MLLLLQTISQAAAIQDKEVQKVSLQTLYRSLGLEYEEEQRKISHEYIQSEGQLVLRS